MYKNKRKWKYGMINPKTGLVFKAYNDKLTRGISWFTQSQFDKEKKRSKEYNKKRWMNPEFRRKDYRYKQNPKYKRDRLKYAKNKWKNDERHRNLHRKYVKITNWSKTLLMSAKRASKKRGHNCKIDQKWIMNKFNKQNQTCYWLGIKMIPSIYSNHPQQPSLDRIDNAIGYTKENTVLCCLFANLGKKDISYEIMKQFTYELLKNKINKQ